MTTVASQADYTTQNQSRRYSIEEYIDIEEFDLGCIKNLFKNPPAPIIRNTYNQMREHSYGTTDSNAIDSRRDSVDSAVDIDDLESDDYPPSRKEFSALQHNLVTLERKIQNHGNHQHVRFSPAANSSAKNQKHSAKIMGQDKEGCPCCIAGLDLDEVGEAINSLGRHTTHEDTEQLVTTADLDSTQHWGLFLGITGPFALLGLTAVMRNLKGSWGNMKTLKSIISAVKEDIESNKKLNNMNAVKKLTAFKRTLEYSKKDAQFNFIVPGIINGASSTLMLTNVALSNPFALPVIALYATGQLGRSVYDLKRSWNTLLKINNSIALPKMPQQTQKTISGTEKINQVTRSKRKFYSSNILGYALFTTGAILTFLSIPALAMGIGVAGLAIGLALLSAGSLSTGIMGSIWPRKFKPRNGNLGIERMQLSENKCIEEIGRRRITKKTLEKTKQAELSSHRWKKRFLRLLSALPQFKDFMPQSWARIISKPFLLIPIFWIPTGSAATKKKHQLNIKMTKEIHKNDERSQRLIAARLERLKELLPSTPLPEKLENKTDLEKSWFYLTQLNLHKDVVATLLNEGFSKHSHQHNGLLRRIGRSFRGHHNHQACQAASGGCRSNHLSSSLTNFSGFREIDGKYNFNFSSFMHTATEIEKRSLHAAIDYHLFISHIQELRYQNYGLIDFFWQLRKIGSFDNDYNQGIRVSQV